MSLLWLLLACGPAPDEGWCAAQPAVTWESHGEGLIRQWCQPCHAGEAADRHGAPEGLDLDTEAQVRALASRILTVATGEAPSMPPGMPMPEEDRALLEAWLRCAGGGDTGG